MKPEANNEDILSESVFEKSVQIELFIKNEIIEYVSKVISKTEKQEALYNLFFRIHLHFSAMTRLNSTMYFQTVLATTRSIFELYLDMIRLSIDKDDTWLNRHNYFHNVAKYKAAKKILNYMKNNPDVIFEDCIATIFSTDKANSFIKEMDKDNELKKKVFEYWLQERINQEKEINMKEEINKIKVNKIKDHWTNQNTYERADDLKLLKLYIQIYPIYSWFVHGGSTGFKTMTPNTALPLFTYAHMETQCILFDAINILDSSYELRKHIHNYGNIIENLSTIEQTIFAIKCHPELMGDIEKDKLNS